MDQHPIPQDVTGFQFKLVGSMTVKQFGYVAVGVIGAVVLYYMPIPGPAFIAILVKIALIPLVGGSGFAIAFLPIEGRPIDVMATNFFKAVFSPNQYIYHKSDKQFSFSMITLEKPVVEQANSSNPTHAHTAESVKKSQQLRAYLMNSHAGPANALDQRESAFLKTFTMSPGRAPTTVATPSAPATATQKTMPHPLAQVAQAVPVAPKQPVAPVITPPQPVVKPVAQPQPVVQTQPAAPVAPQKPTVVTPPPVAAPQIQQKTVAQPVQDEPKQATIEVQEKAVEQQIIAARQAETNSHSPEETANAHQKVQMLELQKQQLEQELIQLRNHMHATQELQKPAQPLLTPTPQPTVAPMQTQPAVSVAPPAPQAAPQDQSHVHTIPQNVLKKAGLPHVPDTANVVVGIVKDPRGNILPNILVEVKDKEGNPVRAFKTNPLGQFASATPLATGIYTIELEDPKKQHNFDVIQIAANNQIMMPIEVISHDAREELRKQLFN